MSHLPVFPDIPPVGWDPAENWVAVFHDAQWQKRRSPQFLGSSKGERHDLIVQVRCAKYDLRLTGCHASKNIPWDFFKSGKRDRMNFALRQLPPGQ